jgi:imidazolonepropionase-like amidohydrolase
VRYQAALTRAFADAGVPLLVGTDAPVPGVVPGFGLHEELERFVQAGLTPEQALTAATCMPALYLGRSDFGMVVPGRRADLLLLSANPLDDIRNTRSIEGVMVRGQWMDRAALARLLQLNRRPEA